MSGSMKGLKSKIPSAKAVAQSTKDAKVLPPMRPADVSHEQFYGKFVGGLKKAQKEK